MVESSVLVLLEVGIYDLVGDVLESEGGLSGVMEVQELLASDEIRGYLVLALETVSEVTVSGLSKQPKRQFECQWVLLL